jgi:hypothetical protein
VHRSASILLQQEKHNARSPNRFKSEQAVAMLTVRGIETRLSRLQAKRAEGEVFFLAWDRNDKKAFQRASLARASVDQNLCWSCPARKPFPGIVWIQLPAQLGFASIGSDYRSEWLSWPFSHENDLRPWLRQTLHRSR